MNVIGLFLPNPQQLVDCGFPIGAPQGQNREFGGKVIPVYKSEFFDGVGGNSVLPAGADLLVPVPHAGIQNIPAVLNKQLVRAAHDEFLRLLF
ncbi:hypothetical protein SDC9_84920 [bioreactor metagenome]|uniref:Uncharacterized protein n=1 Tax=bioreactor metagenome TaxID=1076179 RepID=A0A644ZEH6_9ZZZZ